MSDDLQTSTIGESGGDDHELVQIPCELTKISTQNTGGWNLTFHVPETAGQHVRSLVGLENKQRFVMFLVKDGEGKKACLNSKKHLTFKK